MDKENENTSEIKNEDKTVKEESNSKEEQKEELSQEDKLREIEDKLTRSYAELENQRRRYEKEKDEAYEFGGMALAKECLNLTDNLERSKSSIINDESLEKNNKDKIIEHLDIIYKDILSIFKKIRLMKFQLLVKKWIQISTKLCLKLKMQKKNKVLLFKKFKKDLH